MKKVINTQLNRNIEYKVNDEKLFVFKNSIKEYESKISLSLDTLGFSHIDSINSISYLRHALAKKSSIGTNTIEKVIVDDEVLEAEIISKSKDNKNQLAIEMVINFLNMYEDDIKINYDDFVNECRKIHKSLFKGLKEKNPGKFKKNINYIPKQKEFLDPKLVSTELIKLGAFISNSPFEGIVIAAIAHAKLIEIHPFTDGNGRVGRLISNKIIETFYNTPLWIDEAMSLTLNQYVSALDSFAFTGNATEIVNYFIDMSIQQMNRNIDLIEGLLDKAIMMSKAIDIDIKIAGYIYFNGSVNVANLSNEFNIHRNTAKTYLDKAVDNGYMKVIETSKAKIYQTK